MSIMVGVGRGVQAGVLIKSAEALERLERIDTLVVDKTGTLTMGRPEVVALVTAEGVTEAELLRVILCHLLETRVGKPQALTAQPPTPGGSSPHGKWLGCRCAMQRKAVLP